MREGVHSTDRYREAEAVIEEWQALHPTQGLDLEYDMEIEEAEKTESVIEDGNDGDYDGRDEENEEDRKDADVEDIPSIGRMFPKPKRSREHMSRLALAGGINDATSSRRNSCHSMGTMSGVPSETSGQLNRVLVIRYKERPKAGAVLSASRQTLFSLDG